MPDFHTRRREKLKIFFDNFVLFHLGTDADAVFSPEMDGALTCSMSHARISDIQFHLTPEEAARYALDIPAFEEYLLDLLTTHRRGLVFCD